MQGVENFNPILCAGRYAALQIPNRVHISAEDGGHIIIKPYRQVQDTAELSLEEALEIRILQRLGKEILTEAFGPTFFNTQENGNWSAGKPLSEQHAIIHLYGRNKEGLTQAFGEALRFPKRDNLQGFGYAYTADEKKALTIACDAVLQRDWVLAEYVAMNAAVKGVEEAKKARNAYPQTHRIQPPHNPAPK